MAVTLSRPSHMSMGFGGARLSQADKAGCAPLLLGSQEALDEPGERVGEAG